MLADARRASAIWEQQVSAAPRTFESWWKLARAMYWLAGRARDDGSRAPQGLERGVEEAADALRQVRAAPVDPDWEPEDREFKTAGGRPPAAAAPVTP